MSIAEILRESLKPLVPVVPLGQNEENVYNNATSVDRHVGTSEKNGLVPVVPDLVPRPFSDSRSNFGTSGTSVKLSSGPEAMNREELVLAPQSENMAQLDQRDQPKMPFPETDVQTSGPSQLQGNEDPISMGERIGIKYASETPEDLGEPVIRHPADGTPLAYVNDEPHVKVFAWVLLNLRFALSDQLDIGKLARKCRLSIGEARKGLNRLVEDGDLKVERNRGREYYWLAPPRYEGKAWEPPSEKEIQLR
ncbi:MAG: hypothetical protein M0Z25_01005 [Nitrospiraceae bacterium]|nr:hypothetical protein [Nitrospiraceae bacterium]